jgi:dTDP-4-amino-4,6-dideoxygalactose transaminase
LALKPPRIRLSKSTVGAGEIEAVSDVIRRGYLGMGADVAAFERELAEFIGGDRAVVCVSSGTAALHLALQACGVGAGDEVLVPTTTYVACFQAVSATGATPVPCDVTSADCALDVEDARRRQTSRTKAVLYVHYASGTANLDAARAFGRDAGLRVIEDAAHAFGCRRRGATVGATGDVVCFSFDGIKNITAGEGGAIVTGDAQVADRARDARLLGVANDTQKRFCGERSWEFDVSAQGWRYHMSNLCAAIGRVQLGRFRTELAPVRARAARRYVALLEGVPDVRHLDLEYGDIVPHIFPIFIAGGRRDAVRAALLDDDIECGIQYKPNHLLSLYGGGTPPLPTAEQLYRQVLTLPLHVDLTDDEQDRVVERVRHALRG